MRVTFGDGRERILFVVTGETGSSGPKRNTLRLGVCFGLVPGGSRVEGREPRNTSSLVCFALDGSRISAEDCVCIPGEH